MRIYPLGRRADEWTRARLDLQADGLYLYRNILSPLVPNLLFVGGEVTTYNNPLTHALQAEWVAALVAVRAFIATAVEDMWVAAAADA